MPLIAKESGSLSLRWRCLMAQSLIGGRSWEHFCVSVPDRQNLSDSEKLVYPQGALKDGPAKHAIEGLSRLGECYPEVIECLQSCYDCPRLIHQTHVRMIREATPLREGNGKELQRLHDTILQHLRDLKAMGYEPSGPFITSALELKLDTNTIFEWQKSSQDAAEVPHYQKLWSSSTYVHKPLRRPLHSQARSSTMWSVSSRSTANPLPPLQVLLTLLAVLLVTRESIPCMPALSSIPCPTIRWCRPYRLMICARIVHVLVTLSTLQVSSSLPKVPEV